MYKIYNYPSITLNWIKLLIWNAIREKGYRRYWAVGDASDRTLENCKAMDISRTVKDWSWCWLGSNPTGPTVTQILLPSSVSGHKTKYIYCSEHNTQSHAHHKAPRAVPSSWREMVWTLHRDWPHRPLMSSSRLTGEGINLFLMVNFTCLQSSPAQSFFLRSGRRPPRSAAGPGCRPGRWRWRHPAACWPAGSAPPCHGFPWCL